MAEVMLSTIDNPFDPFEQFDQWYMFDMDKGYNSCAYLDRIVSNLSSTNEEENNKEIEKAIDEIIKYDFRNIYKKVSKSSDSKEKEQTQSVTNT